MTEKELRADESRLLTGDDIDQIIRKSPYQWQISLKPIALEAARAQRDLTVSECQARVERILKIGDAILETAWHGDYSNGNTAFGIDEGSVRAKEHLIRLEMDWQALKQRERVK